jgi:hypothetical protein
MAAIPLQKRPYDLFISYGHADKPLVDPIVDWLRRFVGLEIWYDATGGDASKRSTELLANAIQSARGCLFFLSTNWLASTWCRDEHEAALVERRGDEAFLVVAVQIGKLDIPAFFKTANVLNFIEFNVRSAAELLRSLVPDPPLRLDNEQDVYFAGPWSRPSAVAKRTLGLLSDIGWRLVGDSPDHPSFNNARNRITSIVETCRGLVAVFPYDAGRPPTYTSPWIIDEVSIAMGCGKPFLLLAEKNVELPPQLVTVSFGARAILLSEDDSGASLIETIRSFDDELSRRSHSDTHAYSFLITSLLGDNQELEDLVSAVEHASKIKCIRGQGLSGQHVQKAIVDRIQRAAFCIADVSNDSRNSLIEAGAALGAGTPLHLISLPPADGSWKRRFMFEDIEMNWYRNAIERIGSAYRIARKYRRRIVSRI